MLLQHHNKSSHHLGFTVDILTAFVSSNPEEVELPLSLCFDFPSLLLILLFLVQYINFMQVLQHLK